MTYQNELLLRDSLSDEGTAPSHGGLYSSPDIIGHDQVAHPQDEFSANYNSDVNQRVPRGQKTNFIYVRAKNLATTAQTGYVRLYRARASLFMTPSVWKNNPLKTNAGDAFVKLSAQSQGDIVVGTTPFLLDATESNSFCLVCIANEGALETIPEDFPSYDSFVVWTHMNPGVCIRNLSVISSTKTSYESLKILKNPENISKHAAFYLTAKNVPVGTTISMVCEPAKLNASKVVESSSEEILTAAVAALPGMFDGFVRVCAVLPSSVSAWPDNASLVLDYGVEMPPSADCIQWCVPPHDQLLKANGGMFDDSFRLAMIGSCGTVFQSA